MNVRVWVRLIPLLMLATVACMRGRPSRPGSEPQTYLEVENRNFADMAIYIVEGSTRRRLGLASGNTTTKLLIPASMAGRDLQFMADPIGSSRTAVSDRMYVPVGETMLLIIPP